MLKSILIWMAIAFAALFIGTTWTLYDIIHEQSSEADLEADLKAYPYVVCAVGVDECIKFKQYEVKDNVLHLETPDGKRVATTSFTILER